MNTADQNQSQKIEGLSTLLEHLKDEVESWTLEGTPDGAAAEAASPEDKELIRRGLYLTAMDILLAEMYRPAGYESYAALPDRVILPLNEYEPLRKALDPYVTWFKNLLFQHATRLQQAGAAEHDAFTQAVVSGTEILHDLAASS